MELYGGVGTIGLNILDMVASLSCSTRTRTTKKCFLKSLNGIKQESLRSMAKYTTGSAKEMVKNKELEGKDICIVDPPRKGMSEEVLAALLSPQGPKRLIYISCGFKAFQRDFCNSDIEQFELQLQFDSCRRPYFIPGVRPFRDGCNI